MECNKDEAIRAKEVAERKMQNKDFVGARKVLLRGRQLYPGLENISQMLMVCEIHCSAKQRVLGSEMDWYGILQVEGSADEISIKKQYRKLALVLHPDKNKFAGAEAAFKLIGEAHGVLSNQTARSRYDLQYRTFGETSGRKPPKNPPDMKTSFNQQPGSQCTSVYSAHPEFTSFKPHPQQQQQSGPRVSMGRHAFWTNCPFCSIRLNCNDVVSRVLLCPNCKLAFTTNLDSQVAPQRTDYNQPTFSQQNVFPAQVYPKFDAKKNCPSTFHKVRFQGNCSSSRGAKSFLATGSNSNVGSGSKSKGKAGRSVDIGVGKKATTAPKFMAEKSKERKPSEKITEKRSRTFLNTQGNYNSHIGSKSRPKIDDPVDMRGGERTEKVPRSTSEKSSEGNLLQKRVPKSVQT